MKKYLASNTVALPYAQILFTVLVLAYAFVMPQTGLYWLGSVAMYLMIGCFGISIGYHRLLTHTSFQTSKFWEYFCTVWGMLAFTGSSIGWVGMHRDHHKYSDKPNDPHSPVNHGMKMLIASYSFQHDKWKVRRLIGDRFHAFTHAYYFGILALWATLWLVVGGVSGLMHVVLIPAVISIWVSTISNYMNHKWGYTNYRTSDESKNNWFNAIFTFGEGWHNNHHARPREYKFGHKWWEIDLGAMVINLIKK